jgi:hypothetical protein
MPKWTALEKTRFNLMILGGVSVDPQRFTRRIDPLDSTSNNRDITMSIHKFYLLHQAVFKSDIISIHPGDVLGSREPAASIQGLNQSSMFAMINLQASILVLIRIEHGGRMISRTVINDDELEVAQTLVEYTLDSFPQKPLAVKDTHHH